MPQPNDLIDEKVDPEVAARQARQDEIECESLRSVLNTRMGRRFIWSLLGKLGLMRNGFAVDPYMTAFNNGRQSGATDLLVDIEAVNSDAFYLMSKESKEDQDYVNGTTKSDTDPGSNSLTAFQQPDPQS